MRCGFNYFPQNKLTKLANLMQFKRMLMFCLEDWGGWAPKIVYVTVNTDWMIGWQLYREQLNTSTSACWHARQICC